MLTRLGIIGVIFLFACSPSDSSEKEPAPSVVTESAPPAPPKPPEPTPDIRHVVKFALDHGYRLSNPDTFEIIPENEHFSLIDPTGYFNTQQNIYIQQSSSARVRLSGPTDIVIEVRTFLSNEDLGSINGALTRKLDDPRQERFLRRPFTYWPFNNSLCHIFTTNESDRGKMDALYNEWIAFQTKGLE